MAVNKIESIKQLIDNNYNLHLQSIKQTFGGWSANAYIAKDKTTEYFVKVYDKKRLSVRPWIERMHLYIPVMYLLHSNTSLKEQMVVPLLTTNGDYKAESEYCVLLLFSILHGVTLGDTRMNTLQIRQLALALAELHRYGNDIPISTQAIQEDFTLPFLSGPMSIMKARKMQPDLQNILSVHAGMLQKAIVTILKLPQISKLEVKIVVY